MSSIKYKPRLYQKTILESCIKKNCLVVLPTGLGKTKLAIMLVIERLKVYPKSKILFLTPTKPLAIQIAREFKEDTDIDEKNIILFTGEISPEERMNYWGDGTVFVSTPQCIENDIINNKVPLKEISLVVFDEAHRGVKKYSYSFIAKQYQKKADYPKILGLTASPGTNISDIETVCKNLYIEDIEARDEESPDVSEYVQEMDVNYVKVDLPLELLEVRTFLDNCLNTKLEGLKDIGVISTKNITKGQIISLQNSMQGRLAQGDRGFQLLKGISLAAESIKVMHGLELLETQGVNSAFEYMENMFVTAEKTKVRATKNLVKDINFKSAYFKLKSLLEQGIEHPKLSEIKRLVMEEYSKNNNVKLIIFTQYRDSGTKLEKELNKLEGIKAVQFVGQLKKKDIGLSQKEQAKILDKFRNMEYNCLISTSVGEEGLDIPKVNTVIFYEPIPSAIRSIQRRGRTARHERGKLIVLITKNTRDEAYFWVAHHKEKGMYRALEKLKDKLKFKAQTKLDDFKREDPFKIFVDSREKDSGVVRGLVNAGMNLEMKRLDVADYIISERVGIERKTVQDFVNSIVSKRILQQVKDLRNNFECPLLILEGGDDIYSVRKVHPNAIRGMISSIVIDYGIPIISTKSPMETANFLRIIAKREQEGKTSDFEARIEKKPLTTKEQQEFIMSSFPGVGPGLAKNLLKKFKSIKNIILSEHDNLKKVDKLGDGKAKEIKRIIDEEYPE